MNTREQLSALQARLIEIKQSAEGREFTPTEMAEIEAKSKEALELKEKIERSEASAALLAGIGDVGDTMPEGPGATGAPRYLSLTGRGSKQAAKTVAAQITRHRGSKAFLEAGTEVVGTPMSTASPLELAQPPTSLLEVLPTTQRSTPAFQYLRQTVFTNQAAIVAPGAAKPTSTITIETVTGGLYVFAHLSEPIDKYLLVDNGSLERFIGQQLMRGLGLTLEDEIINGDGTASHLEGLLEVAGQAQPFGTDRITTLRAAATKLEVAGFDPSIFVLAPADWEAIEVARNTSGNFDLAASGSPVDRAARRVWGTQVVVSTGVTAGTALALDTTAVTVDVDTRGISVEWDKSAGFTTNEVRARVEGRFGFSTFQPDAIVNIALADEP